VNGYAGSLINPNIKQKDCHENTPYILSDHPQNKYLRDRQISCFWDSLHSTVYHWWIRFVGRLAMTNNDDGDDDHDAQCRANIQTRRRTELALSIATKTARSHLSADATTNGPAKRQRNYTVPAVPTACLYSSCKFVPRILFCLYHSIGSSWLHCCMVVPTHFRNVCTCYASSRVK
jgi:hypothetical protein